MDNSGMFIVSSGYSCENTNHLARHSEINHFACHSTTGTL
ncbi:hypothetical protein EAKF1_ch3137c [Escherichia albertii KF1]|nr:hypothetical protein EAKF1_ch3137c [Escherichia albertii KF1]